MRCCAHGRNCRRGWQSANSSRSLLMRRRAKTCSVSAQGIGGEEVIPRHSGAMRKHRARNPSRRKTWGKMDSGSAPCGASRNDETKAQGTTMIEFFFDCSSPWTYLAFHNIQPLAKEFGQEISWRPILVGGIFNTINPSVYARRENPVPAKIAYDKKDMADWARLAGLAIKMRPTVFPVNSVKAMRGCIFAGKDMVPFARAVFEAYWGEDQDISQDSVLTEVCQRVGVDPKTFF